MFRTLSPKLEPSAMASTRSPMLFAVEPDRARLGALSDLTTAEGMIFESDRNIPAGIKEEGPGPPGPSFMGVNLGTSGRALQREANMVVTTKWHTIVQCLSQGYLRHPAVSGSEGRTINSNVHRNKGSSLYILCKY